MFCRFLSLRTIQSASALLFTASCTSQPNSPQTPLQVQDGTMAYAEVQYCSDGDTCRLKMQKHFWVNVRLAGIDAPEVSRSKKKRGQPFALEAKDLLNKAIKGKTVQFRQTDLDRYNRPVVEIFNNGENLNLKLIELGYAEAYRGKTRRLDMSGYFTAESRAKSSKIGLWSLKKYTSPKDYRDAKSVN